MWPHFNPTTSQSIHDTGDENNVYSIVLTILTTRSGREARKLQAVPSRFARMLDALGIKKLSQDVHHKPITVPARRHSRDGHSPDASRSCNVPDVTSNKLLHLPDALNPSALATILNQLHKLDPALSNQAAECLGKSFLFMPIFRRWNRIDVLNLMSCRDNLRPVHCAGKSSLPFDAVPIKSIHRSSTSLF